MIVASASQFHVYLPWGQRPFIIVSLYCKSASRRFQPGEGPSRGLLRYCEIFANLWIALVSSSTEYCTCWYAGHCWQGFIVVLIRCIKKWYIQCWSRHGTRLSKHALWLHLKHHYLLISASQTQLWSRSWTWTRCEGCSVFFTIMNILVIISQWCRLNSMCQCYG